SPQPPLFPYTTLFRSELRHPAQLAVRREAVEDPSQLGVLVDLRLREQDRALGVDARGEVDRRQVERLRAQLVRIREARGDRMERSEEHTSELQSLAYL